MITLARPTRREMLAGSGLILALALPIGREPADAAETSADPIFMPNAFVRIAPDDSVFVVLKHVEFGQGPATGLTTLVAEELDADWGQMRTAMAPANDALYKNLIYGTQLTGGSNSIRNSWIQMRTAGAAARAMLVEAAAQRWSVPAAEIDIERGIVSHGTHRSGFGALAADAARLPLPSSPVLKTPDRFTLIGKHVPRIDSPAKSTGKAVFAMDVTRPGMVHSAILHPPVFGAILQSFDASKALAIPGVLHAAAIPQGVVVYARDTWAAMRGRKAINAQWDLSKAETRSTETLHRVFAEATRTPGAEAGRKGDVDAGLKSAAHSIEAVYHFPFLAHAPMEPLNAVIEIGDGRADVWNGTQYQVGEMKAVAETLGLPFEKVTLHQQIAGGSFGRRSQPLMDFGRELAEVAKQSPDRAPVKHLWTRENDIAGGRYRPLTAHRLRGGVDAAGEIVAWDQVIASQSVFSGTPLEAMKIHEGLDTAIVEGAVENGYRMINHRVGVHVLQSGVLPLWWRSVGNMHTSYAIETFLDRLLELGGHELLAGRLALAADDRMKGALTRVAEISNWGGSIAEGHARGIACRRTFGTTVAQVVELSRGADGQPKVHKVWCAVDCGIAVNPSIVTAQMEGGIGFGLGHALFGEISMTEGGRVEQHNFDGYRSLRIHEMPDVEVSIIESGAAPTGVGEPGVPPIAPAVANAWRKLTGQAITRLPFSRGITA